MKRYYNIVVTIVIAAVLGVFLALFQFQSEDESAADYAMHEMNDGWSFVSASSANGMGGVNASDKKPYAIGGKDDVIHENPDRENSDRGGTSVSLPYNGTSKPEELVVFQNTIPQEYAGLTLAFYSTESSVRITLDDEVIYQYGVESQRLFGKSPGSRLNFVDIPERIGRGTLRIELKSSYENAAASLSKATVAQRDVLILGLVENNLVNLFSCLAMLLCAVVFFITGIVCVRIGQKTYNVFWLAALSIDVGVYYLFKTEMLSIFWGASAVYYIGQYLFIMLISLFLLMYLGKDLRDDYPRIYAALFNIINLNISVQIILQLADILDLADTVKYTAVLFRVFLVLCICLYVRTASRKRNKQHWFMAAACMVLLLGELKTVFLIGTNQLGNFSIYAMTLFLIALAVHHIILMTQEYKEKADESARLALAASEAKGKFLANMSHEIRTPLNAVLGMDEMILREASEPKIRGYAMDIFSSGQMLLSLINDILDLSKIESGKMEIIPANYDVSSMIHDLANMTVLRAEKKNLSFHVEADHEIPSVLFGDDVRIRQVLTNILTNAVKYTQEGDIWLRVRKDNLEGDTVTLYFEVEDTGIGIKEEDLPKLCVEFERIEESRNRSIEGTGLGMSITLRLLNMMGSSLQVDSVYGKGSRFYFLLKQTVKDEKPIGDFEQNVRNLASEYTYTSGFIAPEAEILVVDDNAINRKVFGNLLNQTKVNITEADSGMRCLELTRQKRFDIIFLDHMMPEMDGVETLQKLKADTDNLCQDIPVIALTANAVSGAKERYLEIGFNAYLSKPIVSEKLENMLWEFLPKELIKEAADTDRKVESVKPDLEQLPSVDGLDWNYAWLHLSGMELLQSTTEAFYEQIPAAAEKLEGCYHEILGTGDCGDYRIQVHAMKSLAATLGILPLAGMAKVLEDAAKNGRAEVIESMHPIFMTEWNAYRARLVGVFGIKAEDDKTEPEDYSIICALLEMINIAMQDMDIDEADAKLKMVCSYRYNDKVQGNIDILKAAVENLDPEQTESCVRAIIDQLSKKETVQ
ncbi:MAG: response regulator [Butyrivibrio sp.]|nr:response regulator [Muribaculum sp.]MCM1552393.1 response regulator [Butyrivibrio sp.]